MEQLNFKDLDGRLAVVTGGAGVLCRVIASGLSSLGVRTVILDINKAAAIETAREISSETGVFSMGIEANVLDRSSLETAREIIIREAGRIDFLVNGAGGNSPAGTTKAEEILPGGLSELENSFFGLETEGMKRIFDLNYYGTLLPTMVFGRGMVESGKGAILNISSLSAYHPLTKVPVYSSAKAAISNFTEWLAVHLAKTGVRVNAIAPGFFLTHQNRFLLINEQTGNLSPRGEKIMAGTPMGRFGEPEELAGAAAFLLSDMAKYITGTVMLVDGGYNAYSGV